MKTIHVSGLGEVLCRKHRRARRVIVHVSAHKGIWVTLPFFQSYRDAENVVKLNRKWIDSTLSRVKLEHEEAKPLRDKFDEIGVDKARQILTFRLEELAQQYGFYFRRVSVREQRTRWGSCSSKQCISLNVKLALLPEELRDYVMLHELVHTRIHNHSPAFYAELDKITADRRNLASRLRKISLHVL